MCDFIFEYVWARISKKYCDICNRPSPICLNAKFGQKNKIPQF